MVILAAVLMIIFTAVSIMVSIASRIEQDRKIEGLTRRVKDLEANSLPTGAVIYRKRG